MKVVKVEWFVQAEGRTLAEAVSDLARKCRENGFDTPALVRLERKGYHRHIVEGIAEADLQLKSTQGGERR